VVSEPTFLRVEGSLPDGLEGRRRILLGRIEEIDRRHRLEAEPYLKELSQIESLRPVRYFLVP
jgi:hypothetical protein